MGGDFAFFLVGPGVMVWQILVSQTDKCFFFLSFFLNSVEKVDRESRNGEVFSPLNNGVSTAVFGHGVPPPPPNCVYRVARKNHFQGAGD